MGDSFEEIFLEGLPGSLLSRLVLSFLPLGMLYTRLSMFEAKLESAGQDMLAII